jgi:hypothetical protein
MEMKTKALFEGAPEEHAHSEHVKTGKTVRWRKALYPYALEAVDQIRKELLAANIREATQGSKKIEKLILRNARKRVPAWAWKSHKTRTNRASAYPRRVWFTLIREIIGVKEPPRSKRAGPDETPLLGPTEGEFIP